MEPSSANPNPLNQHYDQTNIDKRDDQIDQEFQELEPEVKTEEPHWEKLGNKDYLITAYRNGQEVNLTLEQYEKLQNLVIDIMEEKPSLKELNLIRITPKSILNEQNTVLFETDQKVIKVMKEVFDLKSEQKVVKETPEENILPQERTEKKKPIVVNFDLPRDFDFNNLIEKEDTPQIGAPVTKHLTLIEQHKYYNSFIDKFKGRVEKELTSVETKLSNTTDPTEQNRLSDRKSSLNETLRELNDLRDKTLARLVGIPVAEGGQSIYPKEWLEPIENPTLAESLWSGKTEGKRLKEAKELLSDSMVEAAAILENGGIEEIGTVHYETGLAIAKDKRAERLNEEGKIEVKRVFEVETDKGDKLTAKATTTQFAEKFIGSMEKRVRDPQGKLHGVNIQTERIVFKDKNGKEVTTTQLRSGSFDMNGIKKFDKEGKLLDKYKLPSSSDGMEKTKAEIEKLNSKAHLKEYINKVRSSGIPEDLASLILALKELRSEEKLLESPDRKGWDHALKKYETEYSDMKYNDEVIKLNTEVMKETFKIASDNDSDPNKKLGYKIPDAVQGVLNTIPGLEAGTQNWGMVSLQSPVNVSNEKGVNEWIAKLRSDLNKLPKGFNKLSKPILKQLDQLVSSDTSELDPVHRELKGYQQACIDSQISNGLYINFPTNFIGADKTLFRLGNLYEIEIPLKKWLNQGLVDQARYNDVVQKTQESANKLYRQSNQVLVAVQDKLRNDDSLTPGDRATLQQYKNSLESLINQTFTNKNDSISFAHAPGEKAQYETIGRATALMQLLGYKTTGHCRSGNNRTAAWLSKTYQIFSTMLASEDGKIPPSKETAGQLATTLISLGTVADSITDSVEKKFKVTDKVKKDHWSLQTYHETYKSSLELQEVNKGTQGTKTKVDEIGDNAFRQVTTRGAFDLAGAFNEKALDDKKWKMLAEGKLTEEGIHTFAERIRAQALMAALGEDKTKFKEQIERLKKLDKELEKNIGKYDGEMIDASRKNIKKVLEEINEAGKSLLRTI